MGRDDPGSKSAVKKGCLCPQMDNAHGKGIPASDGQVLFWMTDECPMHGARQEEIDPEEAELDKYLLPRVHT